MKTTNSNDFSHIRHHDQLLRAANQFRFCEPGRVLLALIDHARQSANGEWGCYPSKGRLADLTGYSARSIQTYLQRLNKAGLIKTTLRKAANSLHVFNLAAILAPSDRVMNDLHGVGELAEGLASILRNSEKRRAEVRAQYQGKTWKATGHQPSYSQGEQAVAPPAEKRGSKPLPPNKSVRSVKKDLDQDQQREREALPPLSKNSLQQGHGKQATSHQPTPYHGPSSRAVAMQEAIQQLLTAKFEAAKAVIDRFAGAAITKAQTPPELQKARDDLTRLHYEATNCRFTGLAAQLGQLISHHNLTHRHHATT